MLKCLVSDLDGTLLKIGDQMSAGVSEENRRALQAFAAEGGRLALASSRGIDFKPEMEKILGFPVCFIGLNGFVVCDESGAILDRKWMALDSLREIAELIRETGLNASLITTDEQGRALGYGGDADYPQIIPPNCPVNRGDWGLSFEIPQSFVGRCAKISMFVEPSEHKRASILLHDRFGDRFEIAASDLDMQDISPKGVNKGAGIRSLAQGFGLSLNEIAVVGDNENDLSMFDTAALSYCMDHAPKAVSQRASATVGSVAEALRRAKIAADLSGK